MIVMSLWMKQFDVSSVEDEMDDTFTRNFFERLEEERRMKNDEPSVGAVRAAKALDNNYTVERHCEAMLNVARIIDEETHLKELVGALELFMKLPINGCGRPDHAPTAEWSRAAMTAGSALTKVKGTA